MTPLTQIKIARGLFKAPATLTEVDRNALAVIQNLGGEITDAGKLGTLVSTKVASARNQRLLGGRLIKRLEGMGLLERRRSDESVSRFALTESGAEQARASKLPNTAQILA